MLKGLFKSKEKEPPQPPFARGDVVAFRGLPAYGIGVVISPEDYPDYVDNPRKYRKVANDPNRIFIKTGGGYTGGSASQYAKIGTIKNLHAVRDYMNRQRMIIVEEQQMKLDSFDTETEQFISFLEKIPMA